MSEYEEVVSEEPDTERPPAIDGIGHLQQTHSDEELGLAKPDTNPNRPVMSGHCMFPQTAHPEQSHERCGRNGAGAKARHGGWHPCPCHCHLGEVYECGNCGRLIAETLLWQGTGEMVYVHIDADGAAVGEDCS